MTGNSSAAAPENFNERLLDCVDDINKLLPGLGRRYELTVILSALAEHLGSALQVLLTRKVCNAQQVHQVLQNIETSTFLRKPAQAKAESTSEEADAAAPAEDGSEPPDSDP